MTLSDNRTIEKIGIRNRPIRNASGTSSPYEEESAATGYSTPTATIDGMMARCMPSLSISRPRHGEPTPAPIVEAAATMPA